MHAASAYNTHYILLLRSPSERSWRDRRDKLMASREVEEITPLGGIYVDDDDPPQSFPIPQPVPSMPDGEAPADLPDFNEFDRPPLIKEHSAARVAIGLLWIFGLFLAVFFLGSIIFIIIVSGAEKASEIAKVTSGSVIPLINSIGDIAQKVFGPLLAFMLGYYFGKKEG